MEQQFNNRQNEQPEAQAQAHAQPAFSQPNAQPHANIPASQYQHAQPGKGKGTASLVLGILSIVDPFIIFGIPLGIIGIVLACMSKKEGHTSGVRTAGFVCSIVGLVLNVLILVWILFSLALFMGSLYYFDSFFDYIFYYM